MAILWRLQATMIVASIRVEPSDLYVMALLLCAVGAGYILWRTTLFAHVKAERGQSATLRKLLAAVVDSSSDAIITIDSKGNILSWNSGAEKVFGYAAVDAIGQSILMLRSPDHLREDQLNERYVGDTEQHQKVVNFDAVRLRKDGAPVYVSVAVSPVRDSKGAIFGKSIVARDVTEAKEAEAALRESEDRFEALANGIPNLACMAGPDGNVFWYNQRWYDYTGTTASQMSTNGWQPLHDPEVLPLVIERWGASIHDGNPFEMEFPLLGADGQWHTFLTRGVPVRDAAGRVVRWFCTNTDISERKEAQDLLTLQAERLFASQGALQAQKLIAATRTAQLEAANQDLETFTYSVSHDLRAPLRHIGAFSKILSDDFAAALPPEANGHLQRIEAASHRAGMMVDALLSLTRLGRQSLKLSRVAMNTIVEEVLLVLEEECEGREMEWRIHRLPVVECDRVLMTEVMQNLLSNAIKYSRGRKPAIIEVGSQPGEDQAAVIFVRDNGAGFDMRYADRLFGVFQRLHTDDEFEGTGIGLATVHRIVQKHGGRVWAEAKADLGATFYVRLGGNLKQTDDAGNGVTP